MKLTQNKVIYSYQDVIFMRFATVGIRRVQFSDNFAQDSWKHCILKDLVSEILISSLAAGDSNGNPATMKKRMKMKGKGEKKQKNKSKDGLGVKEETLSPAMSSIDPLDQDIKEE